jgi:M6 family metalloprotease-like protein
LHRENAMQKRFIYAILSMMIIGSLLTISACVIGDQSSAIDSPNNSNSENDLNGYFIPNDYSLNYKTVRLANNYRSSMPSIGNVKMLVIPVEFPDYRCQDIDEGCQVIRHDIEKAFFGLKEETGWHSVASYYQESSYGKLQIDGIVSDWYIAEDTAVNLANSENTSSVTTNIMIPAIDWFKNQYQGDITQFDKDDDGYFDAVYLVYSLPMLPDDILMPEDSRIFWAFTAYNNQQGNMLSPNVFHYSWSSYKFMYQDGYYQRDETGKIIYDLQTNEPIFHPWLDDNDRILIDAHVYIHEVGHLLGLVDYYSYDYKMGDWGPSGAVDMMDYNVGDHNAYSKVILGWAEPLVVTDSTEITMTPFVDDGQFVLLTNEYNQTLIDEYLIIEFYTPDGLNKKDSLNRYAGRYPLTFSIPGLKIYHVDSRVARFITSGGERKFDRYVTSMPERSTPYTYRIGPSNTASRSSIPEHKLLHLLEANGLNSFKHGAIATNNSLFTAGDSFGYDTFVDFRFNSGRLLPYRFTITELNENQAIITIVKTI